MAKAELNLVTPLWTGDATKEARHVEGTGIVGSLRWWYEALIRGMGGRACSPAEDPCKLNLKEFAKLEQRGCRHADTGLCLSCERVALGDSGLCPACQLFGSTGWAKTFHLMIEDTTRRGYPPTGKDKVHAERPNAQGKKPAYFFPPGRVGFLSLNVLLRHPADEDTGRLLCGLLEFIRRNAALGAKTSLGYGLFDWENKPEELPDATWFATEVSRRAKMEPETEPQKGTNRWPDLREMFFATIKLPSLWRPEDFVNFKYDLRGVFREGEAIEQLIPDGRKRQTLRHFLLGTIKEKINQATKIKMAVSPKRDTLKVWGWVPKDSADKINREVVVQLIRQQIEKEGTITQWREFDSPRDTISKHITDPQQFLQSLMEE